MIPVKVPSAWEYVFGQSRLGDIISNILHGNPIIVQDENDIREVIAKLVILTEFLEGWDFTPDDTNYAKEWVNNAYSQTLSGYKKDENDVSADY